MSWFWLVLGLILVFSVYNRERRVRPLSPKRRSGKFMRLIAALWVVGATLVLLILTVTFGYQLATLSFTWIDVLFYPFAYGITSVVLLAAWREL